MYYVGYGFVVDAESSFKVIGVGVNKTNSLFLTKLWCLWCWQFLSTAVYDPMEW